MAMGVIHSLSSVIGCDCDDDAGAGQSPVRLSPTAFAFLPRRENCCSRRGRAGMGCETLCVYGMVSIALVYKMKYIQYRLVACTTVARSLTSVGPSVRLGWLDPESAVYEFTPLACKKYK